MMICDLVSLVSIASVAASLVAGHLWLPHLLVVAFLEGSAVIFYRLAERAAVRNVVDPGHLSAAMSQNEARSRAAGLLGQPLSSSLFALIRWLPFVFTAACHLIALISLLLIRKPFQAARPAGPPRRMHVDIREGLGWLVRQPFLRSALSLVATTNILFQVLSLALVVIVKQGGGSPAYVGFIGAVSGVGGILGALCGSWFVQRYSPARVIIGVFAAWAVLMPSIALTGNPVVLGALFAGMTFAGALMNVMAGVYQVQITPDGMQGRIGSVAGLISSGANSLGALAGGFLLHAYGTTTTVIVVGVVMLLVTTYAAASPAIRSANTVAGRRNAAPGPPDQPQNA
jgi:predicted MFS family arabinose efflux permease